MLYFKSIHLISEYLCKMRRVTQGLAKKTEGSRICVFSTLHFPKTFETFFLRTSISFCPLSFLPFWNRSHPCSPPRKYGERWHTLFYPWKIFCAAFFARRQSVCVPSSLPWRVEGEKWKLSRVGISEMQREEGKEVGTEEEEEEEEEETRPVIFHPSRGQRRKKIWHSFLTYFTYFLGKNCPKEKSSMFFPQKTLFGVFYQVLKCPRCFHLLTTLVYSCGER